MKDEEVESEDEEGMVKEMDEGWRWMAGRQQDGRQERIGNYFESLEHRAHNLSA